MVRKLFDQKLPFGAAGRSDCSVEESVTDLTAETLRERHGDTAWIVDITARVLD